MTVSNLGEIKAIAFDIDGTLYKQGALYWRMPFHFIRHSIFFLYYGIARRKLRDIEAVGDFAKIQAEYMAKFLHTTAEKAQEKLNKIVYEGLAHYFVNIKPCKDSVETVKKFQEAGFKLALLSDFPPEQKGELWGIKSCFDVVLGSEDCGALKPSVIPFKKLSEMLGIAPEEILYVGNSFRCDVKGAKNAGMKSAWFTSLWNKKNSQKAKVADITFSSYNELMKIVLG